MNFQTSFSQIVPNQTLSSAIVYGLNKMLFLSISHVKNTVCFSVDFMLLMHQTLKKSVILVLACQCVRQCMHVCIRVCHLASKRVA